METAFSHAGGGDNIRRKFLLLEVYPGLMLRWYWGWINRTNTAGNGIVSGGYFGENVVVEQGILKEVNRWQ